jgi:hypothetical protein
MAAAANQASPQHEGGVLYTAVPGDGGDFGYELGSQIGYGFDDAWLSVCPKLITRPIRYGFDELGDSGLEAWRRRMREWALGFKGKGVMVS